MYEPSNFILSLDSVLARIIAQLITGVALLTSEELVVLVDMPEKENSK